MKHLMVFIVTFLIVGCASDNDGHSSTGSASGGGMAEVMAPSDPCAPINFEETSAVAYSSGLSQIGYTDRMLTYRPSMRSEDRSIPVHIWYPTDETDGTTSFYQTVFERDTVFTDARPKHTGDAPIMIFSHGRRGFGQYSFFLAEYFAARGWVVAAMDHVGDRLEDQETPEDIFSIRPQDISATIDYLLTRPDEDALGHLAGEHIVVAGHSFGGYTTFAVAGAQYDIAFLDEACPRSPDRDWCKNYTLPNNGLSEGFKDERIDLAISMAPGNQNLFNEGILNIEIPTLLITAAIDMNNSDEDDGDPYWAHLNRGVNRRLSFRTGGHFTFTNICDSVFAFYGEGNGCGEEFIDTTAAYLIVNRFAEAFIRRHLFDEPELTGILDCPDGFHPDVNVSIP